MKAEWKIDIDEISKLAGIPLTEEEKEKFAPQLERFLDFAEELSLVDTAGVDETAQVTGMVNESRGDIVGESLSLKDVISNAPAHDESYVVTKGVFSES